MSKLLTEIGENYFYAETIIKNKFELQKIQLIEAFAENSGKLLLFILSFFVAFLIYIFLLIITAFALNTYFDSTLLAIASTAGIVIFKFLIVIIFREKLIYNPITRFIYSSFLKK